MFSLDTNRRFKHKIVLASSGRTPENSSYREVYVGMSDGTYKPCTQCEGSGFQGAN